jgi:hypothetical protein
VNFSQRRFFTSTQFEFLPDRLKYTFRNLGGSRQTSIDYTDVSFDVQRIVERHSAYLYVGLVLFGLGGVLGAYIYSTEDRMSGFNYALIGLIFLVAFFVQQKEYVVLTAGSETLLVLGGKSSQVILDAIAQHRKSRFLEVLRRADIAGDDARRRGLVAWLVERGAVSEHEASTLLQGATAAVPAQAGGSVH